jgi:hypothetical protein
MEKISFLSNLSDHSTDSLSNLIVDLYNDLCSERVDKSLLNDDLVQTIRRQRCLQSIESLERIELLDYTNIHEPANLSTVLFVIESIIVLKLNLEKLKKSDFKKISEFENEEYYTEPEDEILRMPLSQTMKNLHVFCNKNHDTEQVEKIENLAEQLFFRACILLNLKLKEEDIDLEEYRIKFEDDSSCTVAWSLAMDFRIIFDTIFRKIHFTKNYLSFEVLEEEEEDSFSIDLRHLIRQSCVSFERNYFLETFTEYVLCNKLCTNLMRELYSRKIHQIKNPDTRKIIKHFLGESAIVDYNNMKNIDALFELNPEYLYEFGILFYLKEVYDLNPFDSNNKNGFIVQHALNSKKYAFCSQNEKKISKFGFFLNVIPIYIYKSKAKKFLNKR